MNFDNDIETCLSILHSGGVILYPTDTIWGLGCDATNEQAVEKIIQLKKRFPPLREWQWSTIKCIKQT